MRINIYYRFKRDGVVYKDFRVPRDLKPSSLKYTLNNGETKNQYDLDSVRLLFKLNEVIKNGFNVIALPGACAFVPALNMSNINQEKFLFYGFLSSKEGQACHELEKLKSINFTIVLYEAPHRLYKTLQNIEKILGNIQISISREITKLHEEVFRGSVSEALEIYKEVKGEIVIVIDNNKNEVDYEVSFKEVMDLIKLGVKPNDAVKYVSKKNEVSRNILYSMYEEVKK